MQFTQTETSFSGMAAVHAQASFSLKHYALLVNITTLLMFWMDGPEESIITPLLGYQAGRVS